MFISQLIKTEKEVVIFPQGCLSPCDNHRLRHKINQSPISTDRGGVLKIPFEPRILVHVVIIQVFSGWGSTTKKEKHEPRAHTVGGLGN
jgi:hypothetical protein